MKKIGRFVTMLTLAAVLLWAQVVPAHGASSSVTADIPVEVILTGEAPDPAKTYTIVLKADDSAYPMPEGAQNGEAVTRIKGAGESSFCIPYAHPGTYTYTVSQRAGADRKCTYDSCVYEVTVYVTNSETEAGALDAVVKAEKKSVPGSKCPIVFTNAYPDPKPTATYPWNTPKTGDESNLPLYFAMAVGGALVLAVLFLTRKKADPE